MASAAKTDAHEGQFSKVFGTVGNLQQVIAKLQTATARRRLDRHHRRGLRRAERGLPNWPATPRLRWSGSSNGRT